MTLLERLGIRHPILLAPMGGGPGTPELAAAVTEAGGLGAIAGAYLTPSRLREELARTRALTSGPLNVNLFAGGYHTSNPLDPAPMLDVLRGVHEELGLAPPSLPNVPPDPFLDQLNVVLEAQPRVFSFTFGVPSADVLQRLRDRGVVILGTATTADEGRILAEAGVDAIVAQGAEAGAHRGTFAAPFEDSMVPTLELVRQLSDSVHIPVIASGGIMTGEAIAAALRAGASAVQLGTAFLQCPEAGTSAAYRRALGEPRASTITRAYSGRPARGLRNTFIDVVAERDDLILPFPLQNSLTRPMRAAAAEQDNSEYLSLWAGTGVAQSRALPAAELIATLIRELAKESA
ncbi:MAG TPA: nitronate monooxygenase [Thermoanaerobaculia bacterium]|jgi:nitronate monooxygenase